VDPKSIYPGRPSPERKSQSHDGPGYFIRSGLISIGYSTYVQVIAAAKTAGLTVRQ
jgi:hypothetical protein